LPQGWARAKENIFQAVIASDEWLSPACKSTSSTNPAQMYIV